METETIAEPSWKAAMKTAVRSGAELHRILGLPPSEASVAEAEKDFPVFVPRSYIARMKPGDPADPLLRQTAPLGEELQSPADYSRDPLQEASMQLQPGLLQKYAGRALMVTTGACPVHCRYCFRRHYPYSQSPRSPQQWAPAIEQLAADASLQEVLLSGGDPLTLSDSVLAELARQLAEVSHLRRLRIHSRMPVILPERVDESLLRWLEETRLKVWLVIHSNHPAELDDSVAAAMGKLSRAGVGLLNQSVLLRGVNDSLETLVALSERLVDLGVTPYYLHLLDRVRGAAHFETAKEQGIEWVRRMREMLPGYAVPRLSQEIPDEKHKTVWA